MRNGLFPNRSIRFKLLFYFVIIISFSILAIGLLGSTLYQNSIKDEMNTHTTQMMNQVKSHVQVYMEEMDNIAYYLSRNETVLDFVRTPPSSAGESQESENKVKAVQSMYLDKHAEIAGTIVVSRNGRFAGSKLERITRDPLTAESWYRAGVEEPDRLHLISHPIGRNIRTAEENISADQILSFVRAIKDPDSGRVLGAILIDMKLDIIQDLIDAASLGKSGFIFIMDESGGIVYSPVNPIVYRIPGEWFADPTGSSVKTIRSADYQIFHHTFSGIGWRIVGVFPLDESLKVVKEIRLFTALIAVVTLFLAFVASVYFTNSIVLPLGKLRSLMKRVEAGDLSLRFRSKSKDEIGQLGNSFNNMVDEIDNLIALVYQEQKAKREAELKTLQAQIKPHFLYNTLDTIQWMALDREADDIAEIVIALTHLFRISLSKGQEIIPLRDELQHVVSYLKIQMARYEGKLDYVIDVPESLLSTPILKILLQPLVENAIYHGIKPKTEKGLITIRGRKEAYMLVLVVEDNGIGIPGDVMSRINELLQSEHQVGEERGYGLFNVNERIKLSHGKAYGLTLESEYGRGTKAILHLPLNG
ncbi:sensor histidine kinase [Cohnella terricola]|uniref:histidine kinase n=2 Tax=Cohnella terricola TaxID=1289167 RepID=A0A559JNL5_9BACL|nr:sensor histidine kinase [Cohnella terricola]